MCKYPIQVTIDSVTSGGVVNIGNAWIISPVSYSKTYEGAGSSNTGDNITANTGMSTVNTEEAALAE